MGIKELTAESLGKKKKSEWRFDKKRGLWVTFQVRAEFHGVPHVRRGFLTEADAQSYLDELVVQERLKEIGKEKPLKFPTVKQLLDAHRATLKSKKAGSTAQRVFKRFLKLLPKHIRVNELRRKHFKDFADARVTEGLKEESANREITEISSALHAAGDYFADLEKWDVPEKLIYRFSVEETVRTRVIARDEYTRLIGHLIRPEERSDGRKNYHARLRTGLLLYFALLTGLRHGELCGIEKKNFDQANKKLIVERFKTRKSGVRWTTFEPLTDTQLWVLREADKLFAGGRFFFSRSGKIHHKIYSILKTNCQKLDIPYGRETDGGFVPHDARHTFVTVLEHGAVDSSTARSFSGHSKEAMLKRYAHATPDSRSRAMRIIEREIGGDLTAGGADADADTADLERIYEAARRGKLSFDGFKQQLESFYGFLTENGENDVADVADVKTINSDFIQ